VFLGLDHRQDLYVLEDTTFQKLDLFVFSELRHSNFRNNLFSYLEFRTMDKVHKPCNSQCRPHRQNPLDSISMQSAYSEI
jgi:hypothetical protein